MRLRIAPLRDMQAGGQLPADTRSYAHRNILNNLIEQDHRGVKLRIDPMLGFKRFGRPQRSQFPGSNCCTGSTRDSSISAGCVSRLEVRPPSGMQCWWRDKADSVGHTQIRPALSFNLFAPQPWWPPGSIVSPAGRYTLSQLLEDGYSIRAADMPGADDLMMRIYAAMARRRSGNSSASAPRRRWRPHVRVAKALGGDRGYPGPQWGLTAVLRPRCVAGGG